MRPSTEQSHRARACPLFVAVRMGCDRSSLAAVTSKRCIWLRVVTRHRERTPTDWLVAARTESFFPAHDLTGARAGQQGPITSRDPFLYWSVLQRSASLGLWSSGP